MTPESDRARWEALLTEMEDELNTHEEAVRSGSATVVPEWTAPEGIAPLPADLADRAHHLIERINVLSTFVKYQLRALDADREHMKKQEQQKGTHNRAVALFLDASV